MAATLACGPPSPPAPEPRRDVVLVVLDTVRADHLSSYGYDRSTTPNLDRIADEGELYREAWAQSSWTLPAMATILTGQAPHAHGAGRGAKGVFPVRPEVPTLAERLVALGYRTAGFVSVVWCRPESGLARGFERYDYRTSDESNRGSRRADETVDAAGEWLEGLASDEPFFLLVHLFDPHLTYDPPPPYDRMFAAAGEPVLPADFGSAREVFDVREGRVVLDAPARQELVARYDGEIRFADEQVGRLRSVLERLGRWDDALVVVVSDHGEEFWDHGGFEHGHSHHREVTRVPLIVSGPGRRSGSVRTERVRQLDIVPTVLEHAGVAPDPALPGAVLGSTHAVASVAEGTLWQGDLVSVRSDAGFVTWNRTSGERRFYRADDVEEREPLPAEQAPAPLVQLLELLPPLREPDGSVWEPDAERLEELRSLGYVR